jgi:hypothetical protein
MKRRREERRRERASRTGERVWGNERIERAAGHKKGSERQDRLRVSGKKEGKKQEAEEEEGDKKREGVLCYTRSI